MRSLKIFGGGLQHQLGLRHWFAIEFSQEDQGVFVGGGIDGAKVFVEIAMDIARGRRAKAIQVIDVRNIFRERETDNQS